MKEPECESCNKETLLILIAALERLEKIRVMISDLDVNPELMVGG